MLIATILVFGLLLAVAYRSGSSLLFPPALLCGTWFVSLVAVLLSGDSFYRIEPTALFVYAVGACAFTSGGLAVLTLPTRPIDASADRRVEETERSTQRAIDAALLCLLAAAPLFWNTLSAAVDAPSASVVFNSIRSAQLERADVATSFDPLLNLNVVAQFTALVAFYEASGPKLRRWRAALAVVVAVAYSSMTATKGRAVILLMTLFFVSALRRRAFSLRSLGVSIAGGLALFVAGLLAVNFAGQDLVESGDLIRVVGETVQAYWLGGLVAFGAVAVRPNELVSTQPISRFFLETARSLGFSVDVPPAHADYVVIGPFREVNIYTAYFAYFKDHGWMGMIVIMLMLGVVLTLLYLAAMRGGPVAVLVAARLNVDLVFMLNGEHFFNGLNELIKLVVFVLALYRVVPLLQRRARRVLAHA